MARSKAKMSSTFMKENIKYTFLKKKKQNQQNCVRKIKYGNAEGSSKTHHTMKIHPIDPRSHHRGHSASSQGCIVRSDRQTDPADRFGLCGVKKTTLF